MTIKEKHEFEKRLAMVLLTFLSVAGYAAASYGLAYLIKDITGWIPWQSALGMGLTGINLWIFGAPVFIVWCLGGFLSWIWSGDPKRWIEEIEEAYNNLKIIRHFKKGWASDDEK